MSKDSDKPDKDAKRDPLLWKAATKDVKKLLEEVAEETPTAKIPKVKISRTTKPVPPKTDLPEIDKKAGTIDRKTEDRLRKGDMKIDAIYDLHGNTADAAKRKLLQFVKQSVHAEKRCLLVITGKGLSRAELPNWFEGGKGVIKREFRLWLDDPAVKPYILSISEAAAKHGGSGAYYILLRKNKNR